MPYCRNCGVAADEGAQLCPACGTPTSGEVPSQPVEASPPSTSPPTAPAAPPKKKATSRRMGCGCFSLVLVVVFIAAIVAVATGGHKTTVKVNGNSPLARRVAAQVSKVGDMLSKENVVLPFDLPGQAEVKVTGSEAQITYYIAEYWDENSLVEGVALADPTVMAAAFSQPEIKSVAVDWQTDFLDQNGNTVRASAIYARWTRAAFAPVNVTGFSNLVLSDPTLFYARSSYYALNLAIWKATKYKNQIPATG